MSVVGWRSRNLRLPALIVGAALLTGCGGSAGPSVPRLAELPRPAVVSKPYVQQVVDRLDALAGAAWRALVHDRAISPNVIAILRASYGYALTDATQAAMGQALQYALHGVPTSPGNPTTTVDVLTYAQPSCLIFSATQDLAPIRHGARAELVTMVLVPLPKDRDPDHLNSTGWLVVTDQPGPVGPGACTLH